MKDQVIRIRMTDDGALTISYEKMKIMEASDNYIVLYFQQESNVLDTFNRQGSAMF